MRNKSANRVRFDVPPGGSKPTDLLGFALAALDRGDIPRAIDRLEILHALLEKLERVEFTACYGTFEGRYVEVSDLTVETIEQMGTFGDLNE